MKRVKREPVTLPDGVVIGGIVSYYLNGWRTGTVDSIKDQLIGIRPAGGIGSGPKHVKWLAVSELKAVPAKE